VFASMIRAPSEGVKTRIQAQKMTAREAVASVLSPQGAAVTFSAWQSSLWRDVPFGGGQLMLFEGIKAFILTSPDIDIDVGTLQAEAVLGAFGGGTAALLTTPFDIITTRIITSQERDGECEGNASGEGQEGQDGQDVQLDVQQNMSPISLFQEILAQEGPAGLFTGALPRTLYWAPAIGIFLSSYCYLRQLALPYF